MKVTSSVFRFSVDLQNEKVELRSSQNEFCTFHKVMADLHNSEVIGSMDDQRGILIDTEEANVQFLTDEEVTHELLKLAARLFVDTEIAEVEMEAEDEHFDCKDHPCENCSGSLADAAELLFS